MQRIIMSGVSGTNSAADNFEISHSDNNETQKIKKLVIPLKKPSKQKRTAVNEQESRNQRENEHFFFLPMLKSVLNSAN